MPELGANFDLIILSHESSLAKSLRFANSPLHIKQPTEEAISKLTIEQDAGARICLYKV